MYRPTTTLCGVIRDEGPYLLEWLAYHRVLGFSTLLVYDNGSRDVGARLLRDLADAGLIRLRDWPSRRGVAPQLASYRDALTRVSTDFVAFLDADEFLVLHRDDSVGEWLARFPSDTGAIGVNWRVFGSGGAKRYHPRPVIRRFTRCAAVAEHNNKHLKYFARPERVEQPHIHYCVLRSGQYLDADGRPLVMPRPSFSQNVTYESAQVNHYVLKSRQEFDWKRARGNANRRPEAASRFGRRDDPAYWANLDRNDESDPTVLRRLAATEAEMHSMSGALSRRCRLSLAHAHARWRLSGLVKYR